MATTPRVVTGTYQDTTGRLITQDYQSPDYATTLAVTTEAQFTDVNVGALTGNMTVTAATTNALVGDRLVMYFSASGANRTVTFSTGFAVSASTLVVVSAKYGTITCIFNGTAWVEQARSLTA